MKKIIALLLLSFYCHISAQGIHFEKSKYQELLAKAKKENKLVFIDAYASWCGPCKLMAKKVFTEKSVGDFYNKNFINAKIDMEKGEGRSIAKKYRVFSYPTYLFINGDGQLISRNRGYIKPKNFVALGQEAQGAFKDNGSLKVQFQNGDHSTETLKKVIKMYTANDFPLAKKASEIYFQNKKDKFTAEDINFLMPFIQFKNDAHFDYFASHKAEIIQFLPEKNYNSIRQRVLVSDVLSRHTNKETLTIDDETATLKELTDITDKDTAEKIFKRYLLSIYQSTNTDKFIEIALDYYADQKNFNPKEIMQTSWLISEHSKDKTVLTKASEWMENLVMQRETSENTFILAKLYHLIGRTTEAKMFAKASINLAKGKKMILAEQLLKKLN